MAHLIDKDALIAEIERRIKTNKECMLGLRNLDYYQGKVDALNDTISSLNTIEVKDVNEVPANVMLNQFGNKYISSWSGLKEDDNFKVNEEIKILMPNK